MVRDLVLACGGCADAFSDKPEWADLNAEIRELLDDDEYTQARASTLTSYYTPGPVVKAMWDALDIGSAPIQVLEPGCGTGNFMAGIPENIKANVSGVELDPISARIAAALNPDATILNADLADCTIHPGFDLTIGNVPYSGDISLDYRTTDGGTSRLPLHDYFIERSVDALRPGGVAMLLTSRYTLDKRSETMRADLARKAELVGAVRLPSSTFARQAGTEAVTDVLVLRRRERTLDRTPDEAWIHSNPVAVPGYQDVTVNVNQAVANDMTAHAVGDIRPVIGRFGGDFDVVFQGDAEQVGERLQELLSTQITHGPALSLGEAEPAGRVLVMDKDAQRNPESVRRFWGRVATGDWDAVIVPESRFSQLHVSKERRLRNMRARVDEFAQAVEAAAKARGDKDPTVKRLEAARKSAETAMQRLRDGKESRDDKALADIEFESLGVDMLIVDEAHHFKNLGVPVASADLGMQLSSAAKCEDLLDKCEWLREAGHGGNIAFMTGTPVSNSMSELYNMQRYLAPGTLKAQGLDTFAAWAGAYGQVVPTVELKPEGNGFQVKQRFARFQNLPELMNAVKQFTDMITNDDIQLPLPELEQVPVPVPITDRQKKEMKELSDRADLVRDGDVPPEVDNLLRITGDGRKIALDPKLLKGHENDRPLENGKIQACAENVARIWQEETPRLGTQLVFCDSSTPASGGWNAYQDLKDRLIQLGVPAEQIAFVHDAGDNPARREQLFAKVRSGEIRVLMGSTQKLGTGTNVQERLAAIHDLDCPWRPADLEQRLGRIQRQGNTYDHVRDYRYVTEGTFDAYSYQTVERKQRFISQLMSSKSPAREAADLDADVVTLANIKALATGDPDIQRRMTLENEINQLKLLRASWAQQKADTRRDINQQLQPRIEGIRQAIREKTDDKPLASKALSIHQTARMNGKWEGMTINGRPVGDRQTACKLLHQAAHQAHDGDTIAEYDGLPVIARRAATTGRITLAVKAVHEHESGTEMPGPYLTGPSSIVSQLDRIVKNMATDPGKLTERLADAERELAAAQETLAEPFAHEDEYRQKQAELERLTSKPDEPRETESRDQETKERSAGMPLTTENARRLLEQDHDVTEVTQGGNAMGHYLEARLTDGRAVQIDFHDNPAWKDTDRLAGRIEVSYANRPQAEWQYDDNDMADREHTVIDPADPAAGKTLAKAVEGWERAGGLHTARAAGTSHLAANQPPEEYAYRWRKPGDPDRHIAYLSTAFDRDQAMKAREDAGYVVTKVDEDPAVLYEQHRKASCMRASHILERYESPDQDAVRILHGIVGEVNAHDPENDIATYLAHPSDKAVQIAGDGLTSADIAEKREMGGWDPRKDPLMRINAQGDWTGITQQQADQIVWDNRDEILTRASYDSELSTWTLHQLDQLKEPQPAQSLDRDRPEPDHKAPAQADSTTKRHGPRL